MRLNPSRIKFMRTLYLAIAFILLSFTALAQTQDDGIYWYGDYAQALKQAKQTGKPLFIEFRCEA